MADPVTVFVAVAAPTAALVGGLSGFLLTLRREQRQAKSEFGTEVRGIFQLRIDALNAAAARQHPEARANAIGQRLQAAEDDYFNHLDNLLLYDPDYSSYLRRRMRIETAFVRPTKEGEVAPETREKLRALEQRTEEIQGVSAVPLLVEDYYAQGIARYAAGDYRGAVDHFSQAIRLDSKDARYYWRRGDAYDELGLLKEALQDYGEALRLDPTNPSYFMYRGLTLDKLGQSKEALVDYNRSLELRPDDPSTLNNRGNTLDSLGRYEEALADYNRSLELRPDDSSTLDNRGNTLAHLGQYKEALAGHNRSLELRPNYPDTLNNRGTTLAGLGRYEEALADINRSLELRPDHAGVLHNRAITLTHLGKFSEALEDFDESLTIRPDHLSTRVDRATLLARMGRTAEAEQEVDGVLAKKPEEADELGSIAGFFAVTDRPDDALMYLKEAAEKDSAQAVFARTDRNFANLRDDPRFRALAGEDEPPPAPGASP